MYARSTVAYTNHTFTVWRCGAGKTWEMPRSICMRRWARAVVAFNMAKRVALTTCTKSRLLRARWSVIVGMRVYRWVGLFAYTNVYCISGALAYRVTKFNGLPLELSWKMFIHCCIFLFGCRRVCLESGSTGRARLISARGKQITHGRRRCWHKRRPFKITIHKD